jgi:XTP/dITP diphosphohydrolase
MSPLLFATGNNEKFAIAKHFCETVNITLIQFADDSDEVQSEDPEYIVRDKAARKFALAKNQPIIVSDDSWDIPALRGFPGAYMKYVDHWFTPQQLIDLMQHVSDRRIFLHQYLAYQDEQVVKIFSRSIAGNITNEPRGVYGKPAQKVISLEHDNGFTISEIYDVDPIAAAQRFSDENGAWQDFIKWYNGYAA